MSATVKWQTSNYYQIATYKVSVTAKVTTKTIVNWQTVPIDYTKTCTFDVVIKSACDTSTETGITLSGSPPMAVTYDVGASQDQRSISYYTVLNSA